jgi:glycosyltransferase involved in cell wall biosynthesis
LFCLAAGVFAYLMVGYPILLAYFPWKKLPPVRKDAAARPTVTALLAVHNGESFLRQKLDSMLTLDYPKDLLEIVVISDGSTDGTDEIAAEYAPAGVRLLRMPRAGKASALNAGIAQARGEILFFTDVRQQLAPDSLLHLTACLADPTVGSVTGELHIQRDSRSEEAGMGFYWRYEVWARGQLSMIDSMCGATGCIYAMRRNLARSLPPDTLLDDIALPLGAFFQGYRLILEPLAKAYDLPSPMGSEFSRHVRTLGGVWQLLIRFPELLGSRDRMRLHFLSHKFGRLLMPYAAMAAVLSSFALPHPWREMALGVVFGAVALALLDLVTPAGWILKRVTSPFRTLLVIQAASLCSCSVFFLPAQRLWKQTRVRESG